MQTDASTDPSLDYAGFGSRLYAYLIDQSLIQALALAINYPILMMQWNAQGKTLVGLIMALNDAMFTITIATVAIGVVYGAWMEGAARGATLGKRYCKLRVMTMEGSRASYWATAWRNVGINLLSVLMYINPLIAMLSLIIYLIPLIDPKRQAIYDKALGLAVVRVRG